MSTRDELFRRVAGAFVDEGKANALIDAYRAEVLAEAVKAVESRVLPGESDALIAHRAGVSDAIAAIGGLNEGGESRGIHRAEVLSEIADLLMEADETAAALLVDRLREGGESRG